MKAVYVYGSHGCKVAVVRRGRRYYLRVWHPVKKQPRYRACKTDDLGLAKQMAKRLARRLEDGVRENRGLTLAKIFRAYLRERTPQKVERYQSEDRRRAEMWKAYLGPTMHPDAITLRAWERFQVDRGEGRIDARGATANAVATGEKMRSDARGGSTGQSTRQNLGSLQDAHQNAAGCPNKGTVRPRVTGDKREGRIDARGRTPSSHGARSGSPSADYTAGLEMARQSGLRKNGSRVGNPAVRPRVIRGDLMWLRTVLRWAKAHGMIERNPCADWPLPSDPNPRRNMATEERLQAILKVARKDREACGGSALTGAPRSGLVNLASSATAERSRQRDQRGGRHGVSSGAAHASRFGYLYELLTLCAETGRRIGAVRQLRYSDLLLKPSNSAPYGAIRWPARTDKARKDTVVPLSKAARRAVDAITRARPGLGTAPLFPCHRRPSEPVSHWYCRRWLEAAEEAAGLPHLDGTLFHAYRRKWATERKHLPLPDVAAAGGWTGPETLQRIYQQPDA